MPHSLDNYKQLTARVDALCKGISEALGDQITCTAGCSSCCTAITLFPVEAAAMREALGELPSHQAEEILHHVLERTDGERCPLLLRNHCLLYKARPIICRTHGLPIIYTSEGQRSSDCCPHNLNDLASISGALAVDLDKLNTLLVAVNSIYLSHTDSSDTDLRIPIAEALKS